METEEYQSISYLAAAVQTAVQTAVQAAVQALTADWLTPLLAVSSLLTLYTMLQLIRMLLADGDLVLMWADRFGKRTDCLRGQVVWITGASSGIGENLAYELVQAGCHVVLSARREEQLYTVRDRCKELCPATAADDLVSVVPFDVLRITEHISVFQRVLDLVGHVDILVNNAGRSQRGVIIDTELGVEQDIMELNYFSNIALTKAVLPHMIGRGKGQIVVTSSLAGKLGVPSGASYCATKHALHGWYDTLRSELDGDDISVIVACPGPVFSEIQKMAFTTKSGEVFGVDIHAGEQRMSTARCARLIAVAMVNKLPEVWISQHPSLFLVYLAQYCPTFAKRIMKRMGTKGMNEMLSRKL